MPGFSDLIEAGVITDQELWSLSHYIRRMSPEEEPRIREVIAAPLLTEGELPTTVSDERWATSDAFWIPLAGQIMLKPRWFAPARRWSN